MSTETVDSADTSETFLGWEDSEAELGIPAIGHIPLINEPGLRLIRDVSHFHPLMEAYRSLRANIRFVAERQPRSILVTSSVPAEGKSSIAANLAMAMAAALELDGKRVILVDADLRRPSQHKIFKSDSTPGLVDVLRGTQKVKDVLRPTAVSNLSVIFAGESPMNPAELLESEAMARFMSDIEKLCDVVIFDSPPTLAVADSAIIAAKTDATLVVIGHGETTKRNVAMTVKVLNRARATVLGTIFNRLPGLSSGYYYGKYYVPSETEAADGASAPALSGAAA